MSGWAYGLVKIDNQLVLCEIYNVKQGSKIVEMVYPVEWTDLRNKGTRIMLIEDLKGQLEGYPNYNFKYQKGLIKDEM